jgi:hypothetical protein
MRGRFVKEQAAEDLQDTRDRIIWREEKSAKVKSKSGFKYIYGIKAKNPSKRQSKTRPSVRACPNQHSIHVHPLIYPSHPSPSNLLSTPIFSQSSSSSYFLSPIIKKPTRPLRLALVILQAANNREHRSILHGSTSTTERLGNARPYATAKRERRTWARRAAETARGARFGRFEALFDGCELGFEAVMSLASGTCVCEDAETYR